MGWFPNRIIINHLLAYFKANRFFVVSVCLLHAVAFLAALHWKKFFMGDSAEYIYEALNIKNLFFCYSGNPAMPIEPEFMTQRQPLYPLFLMGVYVFTFNARVVVFLQNFSSIANMLWAREMFKSLGYNAKYDKLLLLFIACYPSQFINANTVAPDILLQTCTVVYMACFIKFYKQQQIKHLLWAGLALIAGMMVKPVLYPVAGLHIAFVIVSLLRRRAHMQRVIAAAILPLFFVLMYNRVNELRTGAFHFSSNQAFNAVYYFYPFVASKYGADSAEIFLHQERAAVAAYPEYRDRYAYANHRGRELIMDNFAPYLLFHVQNALRLFVEPGKAEIDLFTGRLTYGKLYSKHAGGFYAAWHSKQPGALRAYVAENPSLIAIVLVFFFNVLKVIGFLLFLRLREIPVFIRMFFMLTVCYFAVAAGPIAAPRYFLPVSLVVSCCAIVGLSRFRSFQSPQPA